MNHDKFIAMEAERLGWRKIEAYVPDSAQTGSANDSGFHTVVKGLIEEKAPAASNGKVVGTKNPDAERAAIRRAKLTDAGLTQVNLIVKNNAAVREGMSALAKRTIDKSSWEEALGEDPIVQALHHSLSSATVRLLRINDLEERHRKAYSSIVIHDELLQTRGYRKLFLFLAGFGRKVIVQEPKD